MKKLFEAISAALQRGERAVLCSVLASSGSAPRGAGARMAVFADGAACGTVGGGAVELQAMQTARELPASGGSLSRRYVLTADDVRSIGMICGGEVTLFFRCLCPERAEDVAFVQSVLSLLGAGENAWLLTVVTDDSLRNGLFSARTGQQFTALPMDALRPYLTSRAAFCPGPPAFYIEPLSRAGRVYLFGGGHVGRELIPLLTRLDFRVTVFDDRPDLAVPENYPAAEQVIFGDYLHIFDKLSLTADDSVIIMTPGHAADREILLQVLSTDACYIGCIGSKTKAAKTNEFLLANGVPDSALSRIHCPIGIPLGGDTPAEIAVSVAAELIRHRAHRTA